MLYEATALAHALAERAERAQELAHDAITTLEGMGAGGMLLGAAHETAARVALQREDAAAFGAHARHCKLHYGTQNSPILHMRHAALIKLAMQQGDQLLAPQPDARERETRTAIELVLTQCQNPRERAEHALRALVDRLGCEGGFLYTMKASGPELSAQIGAHAPPDDLDTQVASYLAAEIEGGAEVTLTALDLAAAQECDEPAGWLAPDGGRYFPSLLVHHGAQGLEITGFVALRHSDPHRARLQPEVAAIISRALRDAGDVATVLAAS
jgi:hypothetical protein